LFGSEYRRIYQLSGVNNYLSELVEGVGYNRGLFEWTPDQQAGIGENLHCYAQNGVGMYPLDSNCGSPLSLGEMRRIL